MISCENSYCIYNRKKKCSLTEISVSHLGYCDDCIVPEICEEIVEKAKKKTLDNVESRLIKQ